MTVYADVLIIVNTVMDFFILLSAEKLASAECTLPRRVFAAAVGGFFALYIFAPDYGAFVKMLFWSVSGAIIVLTGYGCRKWKSYLKLCVSYIFCNAVYGGLVICFWSVAKPKGMIFYNGVVYYQISPFVLLLATVLCYLALWLAQKLLNKRFCAASRCSVQLTQGDTSVMLNAIVDTGHGLCEPFSGKPVIVADGGVMREKFGDPKQQKYRAIPYKTVGGSGLLDGFVAGKAVISVDGKTVSVNNPVVALAKKGMLPQDILALISPETAEE